MSTLDDPWAVLGVESDAGDDEIRAAYLARVKQFPPDQAPDAFERVQAAYELLRDPRRRRKFAVLHSDPEAPLEKLLDRRNGERPFAGLEPWLNVLKDK